MSNYGILQAQANVPCVGTHVGPETEARWTKERRESEMYQHLNILQQAAVIRANPVLMTELKTFIRAKRDELAFLLDGLV